MKRLLLPQMDRTVLRTLIGHGFSQRHSTYDKNLLIIIVEQSVFWGISAISNPSTSNWNNFWVCTTSMTYIPCLEPARAQCSALFITFHKPKKQIHVGCITVIKKALQFAGLLIPFLVIHQWCVTDHHFPLLAFFFPCIQITKSSFPWSSMLYILVIYPLFPKHLSHVPILSSPISPTCPWAKIRFRCWSRRSRSIRLGTTGMFVDRRQYIIIVVEL